MDSCRVSISVTVVPILFRSTYGLDDSSASKWTLYLPRCRINGIDKGYTVDVVMYSGELVVTGDMSTDTRCFYDRLLDIPYNGLAHTYTSNRKDLL
jgi:hypothetical protein